MTKNERRGAYWRAYALSEPGRPEVLTPPADAPALRFPWWTAAYVASAVLVNVLFIVLPPFHVGPVMLTWGSFVVGGTFIIRDYAQREIGHQVLWATLAGTALTALMSPGLALASGAAFLASELLDWVVFSRWPGSFRSRVVASSLFGCPLDSALFMALAGFFSWGGVLVMTASKLVALGVLVRRRSA